MARTRHWSTLRFVRTLQRRLGLQTTMSRFAATGSGMRSHAGIASKMFDALAAESINIQMISTSEIKISVVVAEKYMELAVRALHSAFELEVEPSTV